MRLYEIDITSLWWITAEDEMEAMNILRVELHNIEVSEEEIDSVMDNLVIREILQEEAETISFIDDCDTSTDSLWDMFRSTFSPSLVYSDHHKEDYFEDQDFNNEDGCSPSDWL